MSTPDNKPGSVLPHLMQLEQRLMFDGAAVEASVDTLSDHAVDQPVVEAADDMFSLAVAHGQTQQASERAQQQVKEYFETASAEELFKLFNGGKDRLDAKWLQSMEALRQSILSGEYQVRVEFLDNSTIKGALGAFAAEGTDGEPTIYLNRDWVEGVAGDQDIVKVLVEELGHSIDNRVNAGADTAGDEGEGFASQVMGLTSVSGQDWTTENDHFTLELDGESHQVEAATLNFVNAYEMVYDLDNNGAIDNDERWAEKEQNSHFFNTQELGKVTIDDREESKYFSGNDVSAIGINIGGETYYGWISRPIKANGEVRGFYFWTDKDFTDLSLAQSDGNTDGDRIVEDNRGFLLVVDQDWFDQQITKSGQSLTINNDKDGPLGAITVANIGSSSDRVDSALNSFVVPNSNPDAANDSLVVAEDSGTTSVLAENGLLSNDSDADLDELTVTKFNVNGHEVTVDPVTGGTHTISGVGDITIHADGSYAFMPASDYSGPVPPITYTVSDGNEGVASAVLSIQVTPANDAPIGSDDSIVTSENTSKVLGLDDFGTYSDPENDPLAKIQITELATKGTLEYWDGSGWAAVTLNQELTVSQILQGQVRFTPGTDESGADYATIKFKVSDGQLYSVQPYVLRVDVTAGNQAPIANADSDTVKEEGIESPAENATGNVLTGDTDPEGSPLTVSEVIFNGNRVSVPATGSVDIQGQYGTLTIHADGRYTYVLDNSLNAIDSMNVGDTKTDVFGYTLSDGEETSTTDLTITIDGTNDAPVAQDDNQSFVEVDGGTNTISGNALTNDSDVDDPSLEVVLDGTAPPSVNDVLLDASSPISSVTLTVTDSGGDGWTATVPTSGQTPVWTDAANTIPATDASGQQLTVVRSGSGQNATLVFSDNVALYDYQNTDLYIADANKTAIVQVQITSATTSADTTIYSNDDVSGVKEGYVVEGTDVDGNPLTDVTVVSVDVAAKTITLSKQVQISNAALTFSDPNSVGIAPTETYFAGEYGYLIIDADGSYTYTLTTDLAADQVITEQFNYRVTDDFNGIATAAINIRVIGTEAPELKNDTLVVEEDSGDHLSFNAPDGVLSDTLITNDADGSSVTLGNVKGFQVAGDTTLHAADGTATIEGVGTLTITAGGNITFNPVDDYLGPVPTVTYIRQGSDGKDYSALLSIKIQPIDDASVLNPDSQIIAEDTAASGNVLANDTDTDTTLSVSGFSYTSQGQSVDYKPSTTERDILDIDGNPIGKLVIQSNGQYDFVPAKDWNGDVPVITYNTGTGETSTLRIKVTPVNDAPTLDLDGNNSTALGSDASLSYVTNADGVSIADTDVVISDIDDTYIENAVIVLENTQTGDELTVGSLPGGITFNKTTGVDGAITITLNGAATLADYQTAIQAITFSSSSASIVDRVISVKVNDGDADSNTAYSTIKVTPDNTPVTVTGTTVNEASPYVQFQVGGKPGQWVSLALGETGTGEGHADIGTDVLPNLQYFDGTNWVDYTGGLIQIPAGDGTLLVRTPVLQDTLNEGAETLKLTATNQAGSVAAGNSTIIDDGTGDIFLEGNKTPTPDPEGSTDPEYPGYLDDDRPISVDNIVVNEGSGWGVFTIKGYQDQELRLELINGTAIAGDGSILDGSQDFGGGLEYWNGSDWTVYNGTSVTMSGDTLLVRTAIHNDTVFEGQHSFSLGVTKLSSDTTVYGIADIYDDGTGAKFTGDPDTTDPSKPGIDTTGELDDDRTLEIDNPVVNEASDYTVFTLTGNSGQTVELALVDESNEGTVDGKANINESQVLKIWDGLAWVDYNASNLPTFDGEGKIYVRVDITAEQDDVYEGSETFRLNATLTGRTDVVSGTATIKDDGTGVIYPTNTNDPDGTLPGTDDDQTAPSAPVISFPTTDIVKDHSTVTSTENGFTVTAKPGGGEASKDNISTVSPDQTDGTGASGFGVSGGNNGEIDFGEELSIQFDNRVPSIEVTLAWLAAGEDAGYTFYLNGVEVGSSTLSQDFPTFNPTDGIDGPFQLSPENGSPFDQIVFNAPESGDDYLINTVTFPAVNAVTTDEDTVLAFTGDNTLRVGDIDGDLASTTLSVEHGKLNVKVPEGVTISAVGKDTGSLTLKGTQTAINEVLKTLTYTPAADSNNSMASAEYGIVDTLTVVAKDSGDRSDTVKIGIKVEPVVDIANDTATTDEGTPVTTEVLKNDSFEGTPEVTAVTQGTNGSVVINKDGTVTYTPNAGFNGTDSYTYTVTSGGVTETATVNVTVNKVNDPTVIGGDTSGTADEDTPVTGTLTATDPDGLTDGSYFTVTGTPSNGTAVIDPATGKWTYTPNADYHGNDSFTVTITDDDGNTSTQVIAVTVNPVVDIADDTVTTDEGTPVTTEVLKNDSFEGTPEVTAVTQGTNGSVVINKDGTVTYTPNAGFNGTDSYTYTVTSGGVTETASVTVTVNVDNGAPEFVDENGDPLGENVSVTTPEDTSVGGKLEAKDPDGDELTFEKASEPSNGKVSVSPDGSWEYTPDPDYNGDDSFTVIVKDPNGNTDIIRVNVEVTPVDNAPEFVDDNGDPLGENVSVTTPEDTSVGGKLEAKDPDGDELTFEKASEPGHGNVTVNPDGSWDYTPDPDYNGDDRFTVVVRDPEGNTDIVTINIRVTPVNDMPEGKDEDVTTPEDTPVGGKLEGEDPDGDKVIFEKGEDPANGTVTVDSDGNWEYTPDPGYSGGDRFTVVVSDSNGGIDTITINVSVTPAPVVVPPTPVAPAPSVDIPAPPPPPVEIQEAPRVESRVELAQPPQTGQILVQRDIPQQRFSSGNGITLISFSIPADTFGHTEPGAEITLAAVLADGRELPDWLLFDPEKGEFRGVAPKGFDGTLVIRVIARDQDGNQVETMVTIQVRSEQPAETAEVKHEGNQGLMSQLQSHNQFAWKAERDRLIELARAAADERSGNA